MVMAASRAIEKATWEEPSAFAADWLLIFARMRSGEVDEAIKRRVQNYAPQAEIKAPEYAAQR